MNLTIPNTPALPPPYLFRYYRLSPVGQRECDIKMVELLVKMNETDFYERRNYTDEQWLADLKAKILLSLKEEFAFALHQVRTEQFIQWAKEAVVALGFTEEEKKEDA